jgi:hypothetical protein
VEKNCFNKAFEHLKNEGSGFLEVFYLFSWVKF